MVERGLIRKALVAGVAWGILGASAVGGAGPRTTSDPKAAGAGAGTTASTGAAAGAQSASGAAGAKTGTQTGLTGTATGGTSKTTGPAMLPVGANVLMTLTADAGFVDEVVAFDNQRVGYVVADAGTKADLHVVQLGCVKCVGTAEDTVVDLSAVTLRPTAVRLMGQRALVIGTSEDGSQVAGLLELTRKAAPVYKIGPATHISIIQRDGATRLAVHKTSSTKTGVQHVVELYALDTGKRVAAGKPLELEKDENKKLDLHVNHWSDGFTRVTGLKGGEWNKKENQRTPDTEATYDLISGKFVENKAIGDLMEQRKRFQALADAGGELELARMAWDNSSVQLWARGVARAVQLDQPIMSYDPKSLQAVVAPDGSAWLALKVDPVNPDAVARKKADAEYLDVFRVEAGATTATRKARLPSKNVRLKFGMVDGHPWVLERSSGFERGGRSITIYAF